MAIKEVLELVIKGDAKGAIEAFRGTSSAADGAEKSVGRMGGLFDKVTTKFPLAGKAAEKFGIDAGNAGTVAAGAATAAGAAVAAFAAKSIQAYQTLAADVLNFQRISGATAEQSSAFVEVAGDYGVEADKAAASVGKFARSIEATPAAFEKYGIEIAKNKNGTTDLTATLTNAADAFARTEDPAKRAALGTALFGKSWQDMVPLLEKGAAGLEEAFEGVSDMKILSQEDLEQAEEFRLAMDDLKDASEGLMIQVGKGLVPVVSDLAKELGSVTKEADKLTGPVGGLGTFFGGLVRGAKDGNIAVGVFNNTLEKGVEKQKAAKEAADKLAWAQTAAGKEATAYGLSLMRQHDALAKLPTAAEEAEEAERALKEEQAKAKEVVDRLADEEDRRRDIQTKLADAIRDTTKAADEALNPELNYRESVRDTAAALREAKDKANEYQKDLSDPAKKEAAEAAADDVTKKIKLQADAWVINRGKTKETEDGAQDYINKLAELQLTIEQDFPEQAAMLQVQIDQWAKVKTEIALAKSQAEAYAKLGGPGAIRTSADSADRQLGGGAAPAPAAPARGIGPELEGFGTVPVMASAAPAVNLTVKVDAPILTQQSAQWVADALGRMVQTNGTGWLAALGVETR